MRLAEAAYLPRPAALPAATRAPAAACTRAGPGTAAGASARAAQLRHTQRTLGNRAAQRVVERQTAPAAAISATRVAAPAVQRDGTTGDAPWWQAVAFGESVAWRLMQQFAPQLVPIVRRGPAGVLGWLGEQASQAAGAAVGALMRPVRAISGAGAQLGAQFAPMVAGLRDAATRIAANDCSPIGQAAAKVEAMAERLVTPVVETLQPVVAKVQQFLQAAWDKVGAPIWGWLQEYAAQQWDQLKQLASWIWELGRPMRALGTEAWAWLQKAIGIGDDAASENGVLQWVQARVDAAWKSVQGALAPFGQQLAAVRSGLGTAWNVVSGPFGAVAGLVSQVKPGIAWLAQHLGDGKGVVAARAYVEKVIVPSLAQALQRAGSAFGGAAAALKSALDGVAGGLDTAAGALGGSALSFLASSVQWMAGEAHALAGWAGRQLAGLAAAFDAAAAGLRGFLQRLGDFLRRLQAVASDVWALPAFLAEKVWSSIPACLRDPVVDFLVPLIIRQIELFQDLVRDNEAWQKTKARVMGILRQVFVTRDLAGAVKGVFDLILRVFNLPPEMLAKVAAKAMAAWDTVSKKPLEFIKNTVRSLGHGFKLLWGNITTHLEHGVEGWLFGELGDKDIRPPASWTDPRAIFGFVVDVLGLSTAHLVELVKKRVDPGMVDQVQRWVGRFSRAWDWITNAIDTSKSPAENSRGLVAQAKDFGKSVLTGVAEWVAGKVAQELALLAAAAAASGGLSEVLDIARRIYKAMLSAKRWAARMLQMAGDALDQVLDIAGGNIGKVGAEFQKLMDRAMPVVIGFLADQVGLGGVGAAVRNIVERLREGVDNAILWLIDKIKAGLQGLLGGIKAGAAAVANWWQRRVSFTTQDGKPHSLHFDGPAADEPIVESTPTPVRQFLREVEPLLAGSPEAKSLTDTHRAAVRLCDDVRRAAAALRARGDAADPADVQALSQLINRLGRLLDPLLVLRDGSARDKTACEGRSAPGLGRIGMHGWAPPRLRDGPQLCHLESEHIIPFTVGKRLWQMADLAVPKRGRREDNRQITIMIYERAARIKTGGHDKRLGEQFEAALERADIERRLRGARAMSDAGRPATLRREGPELLGLMMQGLRVAKEDALLRTNAAIRAENEEHSEGHPLTNGQRRAPPGKAEPPSPDTSQTAAAADQQFDSVEDLVASAVTAIRNES